MLDPQARERIHEALTAEGSLPAVKAFLGNPLGPETVAGMEDVVVGVALMLDVPIDELMAYIFSVLPSL